MLWLPLFRLERGMSREAFARHLGITTAMLNAWEQHGVPAGFATVAVLRLLLDAEVACLPVRSPEELA
jgi:DNA-binding transcriptional regulator YiaG